ncbi:MAG: hypothetical protein R3F51_28550, partial [Cyanobacteriota/Melainabacteria group bacterium]
GAQAGQQRPAAATPGFAGVPGNLPSRPGSNAMAAASGMTAPAMNNATGMPVPTTAHALPEEAADGVKSCPHCGQHAGRGKFCIECGKFIGASAASAAASQKVVGPMGSRPEDAGKPHPRHGGLDVTDRAAMPSKRESIQDAARGVIGGQNPFNAGQTQLPMQGGGPLSQRVAEANQALNQDDAAGKGSENQRTPVTSLNPDISRFGFSKNMQQGQKPGNGPGVEF